uniref:Uncharacterized protein n=1 Tax=viral metagenome TaxID=1070528 RepID=A0A6M3LLJ2_9ZZZZ
MKQVKKWVYYCDYCKTRRIAKWAMEQHERHCTMNPNRTCQMCSFTDGEGSVEGLPEMIEIIKTDVAKLGGDVELFGIDEQSQSLVLDKLKGITTCPACLLAAIRQSGFAGIFYDAFDFKKEKEALFREHNADTDQHFEY